MPIILPTWEAKIRRIVVPGQFGQIVHETPSQGKKVGVMMCACHPRYGRKHKIIQASLGKMQDTIPKITRAKMARGMAEAVEYLPCKCEVLSSNSSPAKKNLKLKDYLK
jgi:hypothetical protein